MEEVYKKLNFYLNEICRYLEKENSFLLDNIDHIGRLNDAFLRRVAKMSFDYETVQNHLTCADVFSIAREVIAHIDPSYLESFDNLIPSGELDFSFENAYEDSECIHMYRGDQVKQIININRQFNYSDVRILVHEFIHYTNGKKYSANHLCFTEFLSIYFEFYTVDYLIEKGIRKEEIDGLHRIRSTKRHSHIFFQYEIVLLAFVKFGNLDENTVSFLRKYILPIQKEIFEKECCTLYKNLCRAEEFNKERIKEDPASLGFLLSEEFISYNYQYILGTLLAVYVHKYGNFHDVVYLNNHLDQYENRSFYDICLTIGVDPKEEEFKKKLFTAVEEYIDKSQSYYEKSLRIPFTQKRP